MLKATSSKPEARQGQVLVEAIVALGLLVGGFLGAVQLLASSIGTNRVVSENYTAAYLGAEGIEVVKNMIDANTLRALPWNNGLSDGDFEVEHGSISLQPNQNRFLLYDAVSGLYGYGAGTPTKFKRTVSVALLGGEEVKVNAIVMWTTRGGGTFSANVEDHFLRWRP